MIEYFFMFCMRLALPYLPNAIRDFLMWPVASRIVKKWDRPVKCKDGFTMYIDPRDLLGRIIFFYGPIRTNLWEPQTVLLTKKLKPDGPILVAGAHIGYIALMLAQRSAVVYAYEPIPYLYDIARKNSELNRPHSFAISQFALTDHMGTVFMREDTLRSQIADSGTPVSGITIDSFALLDRWALWLLDLEGHEEAALRGAEGTLKTNPPKDIIFEALGDNFVAAINYLAQFGYHFYFIDDDYNSDNIGQTRPLLLFNSRHENKSKNVNIYATLRSEAEVDGFQAPLASRHI
ncbi:hypothetical protein A3G55_03860 [Candidatus Giovannonibacteria bacterium RIFCSPLOWO2_12_FULL_44_25]|uniref:Methyltransferase FkbM domain-containing protein n=2 Tax=Candidatus Giovannoniibacteriota TaxID=1752738 RepID=A0A1F5W857_9BACT|nr:MAG: hypothetical protein A2120_02245 [Candidatus Giovannonibacteria bacterium GWA2_45_15]OGF59083.1 MAG: hypothetical protein A2W40_00390 [Candidatus Giovannonibacteria bacterium RIFCSPHIGHO2_01_45_12]OGF61305.1 MAG: hypothetical protein A2656_05080 [Candidatus Giovannonibacteria bacterium RIFCSPHIGHO2_01_FULL_44_100]OGF71832.1 MAG: hypothetical protein A3C05_02425 [Candidatus Giovannonibacteria bacterium RIFCSPHIGHO2_02_FULL_45_40]OGF83465.1 MAG: hypothetical protein A3E63_00100 [Candidatu